MSILITGILHEIESELEKTKQVLNNLRDADANWKPHAKSMSLGTLAKHVVELHSGFRNGLKGDSFNFSTDYRPIEFDSFEELEKLLIADVKEFSSFVKGTNEAFWLESFSLKHDEIVLVKLPRAAFFRSIIMNHLIHHRGQLTVYMRMLDIPVPGIYGPSADDK